jgi:hypothetical protein
VTISRPALATIVFLLSVTAAAQEAQKVPARAKLTDEGYVVEMAIPFTSLRFPRTAPEQTFGLHGQDRNRNCYVFFAGCSGTSLGGTFAQSITGEATDIGLKEADRTFFIKLGYAWLF